mmetsp:Transcript_65565/g.152312  ORF Transcript_65565/g.152312 Transcript_65565/m.152312 type:complete len:282 (-) Transcript_65565:110-955(-)
MESATARPDVTLDPSQLSDSRPLSLQRVLERDHGGPREQVRSAPSRLRNTRSCAILHSSLEEPLTVYKTLEPLRPRWQSSFRRFHETHGYRILDQDTIVVSARDVLHKTKDGIARSSSGSVTYSHVHKLKLELDIEMVARILADGVPGGGHMWTTRRLEWIFKERTGRPGCWADYNVGITAVLALFPRTFELFGPQREFVVLKHKAMTVIDDTEGAMVRLARARDSGRLEPIVVAEEEQPNTSRCLSLPELKTNRFKTMYSSVLSGSQQSQQSVFSSVGNL